MIFLFNAAQLAIAIFEKAQKSFIDYMDISTKLNSERENIKQLFTLILVKDLSHLLQSKSLKDCTKL